VWRVDRLTRLASKESKAAAADSEKNRNPRPGIRFVSFLHQGIQLAGSRSILIGLLVNWRPTVIRGLMTDQEWAIFAPLLTMPCLRGGRPPLNHRHRLDGILWICRTGAPWRDLPEVFGKWNSVWKQFRRWCESGVWDLVLQALADSGGALDMLQMIDSTIVRAHRCAAGEQTEAQNQALGRSRGGFSTKIHLRCNAAGLPIGVVLSEGEAHDVTAYDGLMQQRDSDAGAMLADKGYDSDAIRRDLRDSGATPEIPTKRNRKVQYSVSQPVYALRSRIECFIGQLKEQRRIATRYDKLATSFLGFVLLGCIRIWARFVHRA
jgi:transposase